MSLCRTLSACVIVTSLVSLLSSNGIIHAPVAFAAQRTSCEIAGQWAGRKGIRLGDEFKVSSLYAFRFGSDGSYSYVVGDEAGTAASHSGTFVTAEATDEGGRRYPCLLTLQPSKSTVRRDLNRNIAGAPKGFESLSDGAPGYLQGETVSGWRAPAHSHQRHRARSRERHRIVSPHSNTIGAGGRAYVPV